MKKFDLESAKNGAKVKTVSGENVTLLSFDTKTFSPITGKKDAPIIIGVINSELSDYAWSWNIEGGTIYNNPKVYNLIIE